MQSKRQYQKSNKTTNLKNYQSLKKESVTYSKHLSKCMNKFKAIIPMLEQTKNLENFLQNPEIMQNIEEISDTPEFRSCYTGKARLTLKGFLTTLLVMNSVISTDARVHKQACNGFDAKEERILQVLTNSLSKEQRDVVFFQIKHMNNDNNDTVYGMYENHKIFEVSHPKTGIYGSPLININSVIGHKHFEDKEIVDTIRHEYHHFNSIFDIFSDVRDRCIHSNFNDLNNLPSNVQKLVHESISELSKMNNKVYLLIEKELKKHQLTYDKLLDQFTGNEFNYQTQIKSLLESIRDSYNKVEFDDSFKEMRDLTVSLSEIKNYLIHNTNNNKMLTEIGEKINYMVNDHTFVLKLHKIVGKNTEWMPIRLTTNSFAPPFIDKEDTITEEKCLKSLKNIKKQYQQVKNDL